MLINSGLLFKTIEDAVKEYRGAVGEDIHKVSENTLDVIDYLRALEVY